MNALIYHPVSKVHFIMSSQEHTHHANMREFRLVKQPNDGSRQSHALHQDDITCLQIIKHTLQFDDFNGLSIHYIIAAVGKN